MVLAKRNANGEFVAWSSSSQTSNSNQISREHENDDAPSSKRARISSANSSPSQHLGSVSFSARPTLATTSRNVATRPKTPNSDIYVTRPVSPGIEVISSASHPPHATPQTTPVRKTRTTTQATTISQNATSSSSSSRLPSQHSATFSSRGRTQDSGHTSVASFPPVSPISLPPYSAVGASSFEQGSSQPSVSVTPSKRGRKNVTNSTDPAEKPEKRQAIFKKKCPQNILDRVERVMTQRIFMIDRNRTGELQEEFSVLGSTGNVYNVVVDHKPRCNCPDAMKGNHCKHILFVMLKVLQVNQGLGHWYQKALLTSELEEIFAGAPLAPNSMAHPHIRDAYACATGKTPAAPTPTPSNDKRRVPGPDDDCPVCYDGMHAIAEASLVFCEDCGNALHRECFVQWQRTAASAGKNLTCVWCRARWVLTPAVGSSVGGGASMGPDGYLNLAGIGGVSPVRDTSTYYHGLRRGDRYHRYQYYDE